MVKLNNVDISTHVDINSIITNDTLDETMASGSFTLPFVSSTDITNGDQPIPRFSQVDIDGLLFVVAEDTVTLVRRGTNKLYRHEVELIEPTKILQKRVIPNITVTQPQGDVANYIYTINSINETQFTSGGFELDNTLTTIPLVETGTSQDTSVLTSRTLKNTNAYDIRLRYELENRQQYSVGLLGSGSNTDPDIEINIKVYYGNTEIADKTIPIKGKPANLFEGLFGFTTPAITHIGGFKVTHTPTTANQTITVKAKTIGDFSSVLEDTGYITNLTLQISQEETNDDKIYLDEVVNKLLSFHPTFTLSDEAEVVLSGILSPEFTFQGYTLYDALREVANYVTGIVYLGEDDFTTIHFYFYDQDIQKPLTFTDEEQSEYLDGFADALEINAQNVVRDDEELYAVKEPANNGFITVRSTSEERGVQIRDTDTALFLQQPIYRPLKLEVRGLAFTMKNSSNQDVNIPADIVWDITEYLVEEERYNTFGSQADLNNRGNFINQSNTIYYRQGDNRISGLGFIGTLPAGWSITQTPNYAIHEAILNKAAEFYSNLSFGTNYLVNINTNSIHNLEFRLTHVPYSDVRLSLYKDGKTGENIKYFNEQSNINDMELLGKIAQENANRTGNRTIKLKGLTSANEFVLGSKIDDKVLVNYTISRTPTLNKFTAEYAVGYANISDYVGIDSRYRQYEVPVNSVVRRTDKKTQHLQLKTSDTIPTVTTPSYIGANNRFYEALFGNFASTPIGQRPTYAKIVIDSNTTVESNIDSYRMGKTIGLAVKMLDNYAAGIKKVDRQVYDGTLGNIDVKVQEDATYTDAFGQFTQAQIQYYPQLPNLAQSTSRSQADAYPGNNRTMSGVDLIFNYTYNVNKDAREAWGFVWEGVTRSSTNAIVYNGFVKYNRLAAETVPNTIEIRFLKEGYTPKKNVDIEKTVRATAGSVTIPGKYMQITATAPSGTYEGLVLTINQEPILAILTDDYDAGLSTTKYIYMEE